MTADIIIVLIILAGALVLFMNEKVPADLSAIIVMASLLISGIISPAESISGFSNTATVTVGAMFIIGTAVFKTGALNFVGDSIKVLFTKSFLLGLLGMMIFAGMLSAFINDTAVVALLMPVFLKTAKEIKISPSLLLMPLSFAALFGGVCTLIGTSTNILVDSIARQHGQAPIGMFEMTPFGLVILAAGIIYMASIGYRLLPKGDGLRDITENYELENYITEIIVNPEAKSANKEIQNSPLVKKLDIDILEIQRGPELKINPSPNTVILPNDVLRVRCNIEKLKLLQSREGIKLKPAHKYNSEDFDMDSSKIVEAVVTPHSVLRGNTLKRIDFRNTFGATVLAIRQRGRLMREKLGLTPLLPGDVLLIQVKNDWLPRLRQNSNILILSEVNQTVPKKRKIFPAMLILVFVVAAAAAGLMPIVASAIIGSVLMVITGVITLEEAYKAIEWKVIFLLAGVLTLGIALEKTGAAAMVSSALIGSVGLLGNQALVAAFFLLTILLTNFMSNNATAALLAPIAILTAESLGINSRPFLMAVTFAASLSLMTPVGYQTNLMIMGPGGYRFGDYFKVGGPLDLIFWILAVILIPIFFPF